MSEIGYYRFKTIINNLTDNNEVKLFINEEYVATKYLIYQPFCDGGKVIKYLNKNGQFRFFSFNKFFELKDIPELIGTYDNFETGLQINRSSNSVVGYRNSKEYSLINEFVSLQELEIFSDIYTSPKVYLYNGDYTSFLESDYIEVKVRGDNLIRPRKNNYVTVGLIVTLDNQNTISLI